jgi:Translation elongation factor Ts
LRGRLKKYVKEICVESQPFVKDPQFTVSQILEQTAKELDVKINFETFEKYQF